MTKSRTKLQSGQAIAQAMLAVCLAVAAHAAFPGVLESRWPFAPFVLAVLASCKWGGRSAGSAATILSAIALYAWYLPAANSFWDEGRLGLGLFIAAGMFVSAQKSAKRPQAAPAAKKPESSMPMFEYSAPSGSRRIAA